MTRRALLTTALICFAATALSTGRAAVMRDRARGIDLRTAQALLHGLELRVARAQDVSGQGAGDRSAHVCPEPADPRSGMPASFLELRALTHRSLETRYVEADPQSRSTVIEAVGTASAVRGWLRWLDAATEQGCTIVNRIVLAPNESGISVATRLAFPSEPEAHRQLPRSSEHPVSLARFRAAFAVQAVPGLPSTTAEPAGRAGASRDASRPSSIAFLGTVALEPPADRVEQRYVIRVQEGPLLVLAPGESEFGWRLLSAGPGLIRLDHGGVIHEIDRW